MPAVAAADAYAYASAVAQVLLRSLSKQQQLLHSMFCQVASLHVCGTKFTGCICAGCMRARTVLQPAFRCMYCIHDEAMRLLPVTCFAWL
jgi:hypothetical protein